MKRKKTAKKHRKPSLFRPYLLLVLGIGFILAGSSMYLSYQRTVLSFSQTPAETQSANIRHPLPTHIHFPTLNLILPIEEAAIEDGIWEISPSAATHLITSARPGEAGNIIIYGHNKTRIFGKLPQLTVGDRIEVVSEIGQTTIYEITLRTTISPTILSYVQPTDHEVLTIYTCTGLLDSKRLLFQAKPLR